MERRDFIRNLLAGTTGIGLLQSGSRCTGPYSEEKEIRAFLRSILYSRKEVDDWLAGRAFPFSRYHSRFGWLLPDARFKDGVDDSYSIYTYAPEDGERIMSNYREKSCRINTYGDSFTQCHQVSDHETWQEVLAAHLQEPVRNFGIGGWSVYQAWLRMQFEEARTPAELMIVNIYEDDHLRNLDAWRNIRVRKHPQHIESTLPYMKVDLKKGLVEECANPCPTPESFTHLCDLDKTYALFRDDFVLRIMLAHKAARDKNERVYQEFEALSLTHGIETRIDSGETLSKAADDLHRSAALFSTEKIVEWIDGYAEKNGKKVLYILSYPARYIAKYIGTGERWDKPFIEKLAGREWPVIDLCTLHAEEYKLWNLDVKNYLDRYFIGHYNPLGNMFCAFAIKDRVTEMLHPRPLPYRQRV